MEGKLKESSRSSQFDVQLFKIESNQRKIQVGDIVIMHYFEYIYEKQ